MGEDGLRGVHVNAEDVLNVWALIYVVGFGLWCVVLSACVLALVVLKVRKSR